jgi:hypothetical protein
MKPMRTRPHSARLTVTVLVNGHRGQGLLVDLWQGFREPSARRDLREARRTNARGQVLLRPIIGTRDEIIVVGRGGASCAHKRLTIHRNRTAIGLELACQETPDQAGPMRSVLQTGEQKPEGETRPKEDSHPGESKVETPRQEIPKPETAKPEPPSEPEVNWPPALECTHSRADATIAEEALKYASFQDSENKVESVEALNTTVSKALEVSGGVENPPDEHEAVVVILRGQFTLDYVPVPPGDRPPEGTVYVLIVSLASDALIAEELSDRLAPGFATLGQRRLLCTS